MSGVIEEYVDAREGESYDYAPYSARMPQTDDLHVLREELSLQRELHGPSSSQAQEAFENLFRTSCRLGRPLDGLRQFSPVESERFFAQIRRGTDGHVYWTGSSHGFALNEHGARGRRKYAKPHRWWWMQVNGFVPPLHDIFPACGQRNCIAPDHQEHGRDERRRIHSHEQMCGAIQVVAMRIGRPPRAKEWASLGGKPSAKIYRRRFGSWLDALVAAGVIASAAELPYNPLPDTSATPEAAIASLREARRYLGHIPTERDYSRNPTVRNHLRGLRMISSQTTIKKYLGPWSEATGKAFGK
jgi:hypothetical protein